MKWPWVSREQYELALGTAAEARFNASQALEAAEAERDRATLALRNEMDRAAALHRQEMTRMEAGLALERARSAELLARLTEPRPETPPASLFRDAEPKPIPVEVEQAILTKFPRRSVDFQTTVDWALEAIERGEDVKEIVRLIHEGQDVDALLERVGEV